MREEEDVESGASSPQPVEPEGKKPRKGGKFQRLLDVFFWVFLVYLVLRSFFKFGLFPAVAFGLATYYVRKAKSWTRRFGRVTLAMVGIIVFFVLTEPSLVRLARNPTPEDMGEIEALLQSGTGPDVRGYANETALFEAAESGNGELALMLLRAGAKPDIASYIDGLTPLHKAVEKHRNEMVRLLLSTGMKPDIEEDAADTVVSWVVGFFIPPTLQKTLELGKDTTPLRKAAQVGNAEAAMLLIKAGAKIDALDGEGRTPLFIAAEKGHAEVARVLLESGARGDIADEYGKTPAEKAREAGFEDMARFIESYR